MSRRFWEAGNEFAMEWIILGAFAVLAWMLLRGRKERYKPGDHDLSRRGATGGIVFPGVDSEWLEYPEPVDDRDAAASGDKHWVAAGDSAKVGGLSIPGGMLYVGSGLRSISGYGGTEPALIDPKLPVSRSPFQRGEDLGYWPSYSGLTPNQRAGFLAWLSAGREDPDAPLGFVFLFFYGLERRLFFDATHVRRAAAEAPLIVAEVERLLGIYGENRSLQQYAGQFLTYVRVNLMEQRLSERPVPTVQGAYEMPLELRVPLGELVLEGKPLPPEWALAWLLADPATRLRTPATRCEPEFRALFGARYQERFGDGLKLKPNKTLLKMKLTPASASFGGAITLSSSNLPDVSALSRPVKQLRELAERCMDELDGLSRFLGRNPDGRGMPQALAYTPHNMIEATGGEFATRLRSWADRVKAAGGIGAAAEALDLWPCSKVDRMSKREAVEFAQTLERISVGIEPDARFHGPPLKRGDKIVLFDLPEESPAVPSREYGAASLLLNLAAAVAAADGSVTDDEEQHLRQHLEANLRLSGPESSRLTAHLRWSLAAPPSLAGLKKRLDSAPDEGRREIARFAMLVAGIDGRIDPGEIKILQRIYTMLGLEPDRVFSDIHEVAVDAGTPPAREPVTIRPQGRASREFKIPAQPESPAVTPAAAVAVVLDMERVRSTMAQTAEVSALLSEIFSAEEEEPTATRASRAEDQSVAGLDVAHSALLKDLSQKSSWTRDEFDGLAEKHGLFPDGAIETLNEASFDRCDGPLIEEDDTIEVDQAAMGAMLA